MVPQPLATRNFESWQQVAELGLAQAKEKSASFRVAFSTLRVNAVTSETEVVVASVHEAGTPVLALEYWRWLPLGWKRDSGTHAAASQSKKARWCRDPPSPSQARAAATSPSR